MSEPRRHPAEARVVVEIAPIKGSRFIGHVFHVADEREARERLAEVRAAHPKANHHVWAWRLGHPSPLARASDDGEPRQTSGPPVLAQIEARGLTDALVVVARYFGGTKLGTGGLIRAYGASARAALDVAGVTTVVATTPVHLTLDYALQGAVERTLAAFDLAPAETDFGARVAHRVDAPDDALEALEAALIEATAGAVEVEIEAETNG